MSYFCNVFCFNEMVVVIVLCGLNGQNRGNRCLIKGPRTEKKWGPDA